MIGAIQVAGPAGTGGAGGPEPGAGGRRQRDAAHHHPPPDPPQPADLSKLAGNSAIARFIPAAGNTALNDQAVETWATQAAIEGLREIR